MSALGSELRAIAQQSAMPETLAAIANEVERLEEERDRLLKELIALLKDGNSAALAGEGE